MIMTNQNNFNFHFEIPQESNCTRRNCLSSSSATKWVRNHSSRDNSPICSVVTGGRELTDGIGAVPESACCSLRSHLLLFLHLLLLLHDLILLLPMHHLPPCPAPSQPLFDPMDNCSCISLSDCSTGNLITFFPFQTFYLAPSFSKPHPPRFSI